jgi:hypothetical protein
MGRRTPQILILSLLAISIAVLVAWSTAKTSDQETMESLVEFVVKHGRMGTVTPEGLAYFEIPADDVRFKHVTAVSESGRSRSIQVRRRTHTGQFDVFLVDVRDRSSAYFYLTSLRGELINAAYLDPEPHSVDDAQERFQHELDFWKHWRSERIKR